MSSCRNITDQAKEKVPLCAERENLIVLVDNNGGQQHNPWKPKVHKHNSLPIMEWWNYDYLKIHRQLSWTATFFSTSKIELDLVNILWTIAFLMIVVTSVVGNTMVLWTVCGRSLLDYYRKRSTKTCNCVLYCSAHRRMWSVTNYFLLNLTIADVMMATLNTIFSFIYMRDRFVSDEN